MRRGFSRLAAGTLIAAAAATAQLIGVAPASAAPTAAAVRVLYYDASRAAEFVGAVNAGAANWNSRVPSISLRPAQAGRPVNITIFADNAWPRALPTSLGNGRVFMGRTAVNEGHDPVRIAAHELGHILGLPDRRTGLCADLMSGSSAGTSCRNAFPNAKEASEVNTKFGGALMAPAA